MGIEERRKAAEAPILVDLMPGPTPMTADLADYIRAMRDKGRKIEQG